MCFRLLSDINFAVPLAIIGCLLAVLMIVSGRRHRRLKWMRWYLALCLAFSSLLYFLPSRFSSTKSHHWLDLMVLFLYSALECWLIFLFIRSEPLPPTRRRALDIAYSAFFYFWLLIWLGTPQFILADTATMMAAEALTLTALTVLGLDSTLSDKTFTQFLRSDGFYTLLRTLGYFSFAIPVYVFLVLLDLPNHPDGLVTQTNELLTYAGFFLIIRKDFHALPLS